jgi:hypothetical protein
MSTSMRALQPSPAPLAVDEPPHAIVGRLVAQNGRQAARTDLVEALQHREAA